MNRIEGSYEPFQESYNHVKKRFEDDVKYYKDLIERA
jgi:hypothetical protein